VEALQALDTVLAVNGVVMVYLGTKYVKAVTPREAALEPGPIVELPPDRLPDSSSFLIHVVKLKRLAPAEAVAVAQPFARLPNSIVGVKGSDVLILRDYSANVPRMGQVLEEIEANPSSENALRRLLHSLGESNSQGRKP